MAVVPRNERHAHVKTGILGAVRLGDPSFPHIVTISRNSYHNHDGEMILTEQSVEMVQTLYGSPQAMVDRLLRIRPKALREAEDGLGDFHLVIDVSRSPEAWRMVLDKLPVSVFLAVTTHGRLHPDNPYWLVGRVTLMSHLATQVARGVIKFAQPPDQPDLLTPDKVREALVAARNKAPKVEVDDFLTDTTTNDDVALTLAAAAEKFQPVPWIDLDHRAVRFADEPYPPDRFRRA
jgi:hypothetical protein